MVINAKVPPCDEWQSQTLVCLISAMIIARVSHLVTMAIFLLFCFPCYFCNDDCCIKRWLIRDGGASKQVIDNLSMAWSWTFTPGGTIKINKDPSQNDLVYMGNSSSPGHDAKAINDPTHCPVCFI